VTPSASAAIAALVAHTDIAAIPAEATTFGLGVLVSVTGRISENATSPLAAQAGAAMVALGHCGTTWIPGSSETYSPYGGAFVMGVAAGVDGVQPWAGATVAAVLAASSLTAAGPEQLAAAVTVGLEVATRLRLSLGDSHAHRGWDSAGTLGVVGAVARLLGADQSQVLEALALAASQAAGLVAQSATPTARVHVGKAAADGLEAARLGLARLGAPTHPLEGRCGMGALMSNDLFAPMLLSELGTRWVLLENEPVF
jgi:2-methylcitrate dehydratase PrpD